MDLSYIEAGSLGAVVVFAVVAIAAWIRLGGVKAEIAALTIKAATATQTAAAEKKSREVTNEQNALMRRQLRQVTEVYEARLLSLRADIALCTDPAARGRIALDGIDRLLGPAETLTNPRVSDRDRGPS